MDAAVENIYRIGLIPLPSSRRRPGPRSLRQKGNLDKKLNSLANRIVNWIPVFTGKTLSEIKGAGFNCAIVQAVINLGPGLRRTSPRDDEVFIEYFVRCDGKIMGS